MLPLARACRRSSTHSHIHRDRPRPTTTVRHSALDADEIAVVTQADRSLNAMFKKPLRVGLLVEPTVRGD